VKELKALKLLDEPLLCLPDGGQTACKYFELGKRERECKWCDIMTYRCNSVKAWYDLQSEEDLDMI